MTKTLPRKAILIVNAKSRQGAEAFAEARDKLTAAGIELIDAQAVMNPKSMGKTIKAAVKAAPMVVLGGGDGSLSSNIEHFMGSETVLAVLPLGTANSFARTMGIPLELDGAIEVIATGARRCIDVGCIGGNHFLNASALGLAPLVADTVPHGLKRLLGRMGYLLWAGWSAASFNAFRLTVDDGKRRKTVWATEARIANGSFHGGMELIESADVESGMIVVQAVTGRSLIGLGWSYFASAVKLRARHATTLEFRAPRLTVSTRPRMQVSVDGEIGPETPFEASAIPNAVTVAAPREKPSTVRPE